MHQSDIRDRYEAPAPTPPNTLIPKTLTDLARGQKPNVGAARSTKLQPRSFPAKAMNVLV
jgi:hypothetical protein